MESWSEWRSRVRRVAEELAPLVREALEEEQLQTAEEAVTEEFEALGLKVRVVLLRTDDEL